MNIVVASDQNYAPHLETLIVSIAENNKNIDLIKFYIFDGGIEKKTAESIRKFKDKYKNLEFIFYPMNENVISKMLGGSVGRDRSLSTYARIFIPNIIEDDRALYLDVDGIVVGSLSEMYNLDISQYAIAGVRDTNPISRHRNVGLSDSDVYINAGMILWNLKKCREINFVKQCIDFVHDYNGNIDAMDQGTINGVLARQGLIKLIHPRFNVFTSLFQLTQKDILRIYNLQEYYSDDEIKDARKNPVFIHFTPNMTTRPWIKHCIHPMKKIYWDYRKLTDYGEYHLDKDKRKLKIRLLGFVYRNSPLIVYGIFNYGRK